MNNDGTYLVINTFVSSGAQILRIEEDSLGNKHSWWVVDRFEIPTPDVNYIEVVGYEITPIVNVTAINNKAAILQRLENHISNSEPMRMKFHVDYKYKLYLNA